MPIFSYVAVVIDTDGSAFITKAEFDSLKNNFQAQIDNYNSSIDSKIDGAIASYLAGVKVTSTATPTPLCFQIYGKTPTFNRNYQEFYKPSLKTEPGHESEAWNAYTINFTFIKLTYQNDGNANGAYLSKHFWKTPQNTWKYIVRADWDDTLAGWRFRSAAHDANIVWNWVSTQNSYGLMSGSPDRYFAWFKDNNWNLNPVQGKTGGFGARGTDFQAWVCSAGTGEKTFDEINVTTTPAYANGYTSWSLSLDAGGLTEVDNNDYSNIIDELFVDSAAQTAKRINRKIEITDYSNAVRLQALKQPWTVSHVDGAVKGVIAGSPALDNTVVYQNWVNVFGPTFTGSTSTTYTDAQNNMIRSNNLFYEVDGVPGTLCFSDSPVFDKISRCDKFEFKITLEDGEYSNADLFMTTEKTNLLNPSSGNRLQLQKNGGAASDLVSLTAGEPTLITVDKKFNDGDIIYFGLIPAATSRSKIRELSDYTLYLN